MIRSFGNITGLTNQPSGLDVGISGGGSGGSSFLDWSSYQTFANWNQTTQSIAAGSWLTFLDVSGPGCLVFANASSTSAFFAVPDFRITVDGEIKLFSGSENTNNSGLSGNLMTIPIQFSNSLKIEIYNKYYSALPFYCDYTYLKKTTAPDNSKQSLLLASQRRATSNQTSAVTDTDVVNITGSGYLLSVEFGADITSYYPSATVIGTVTIDGVAILNGKSVAAPAQQNYKSPFYAGPIRFSSGLRVAQRVSNNAARAETKVVYTLD